jgi:hypothetical protein
MQPDGSATQSGILLAAGIAAYLVLAAVYAGRLAINRAGVRADAAEPGRAVPARVRVWSFISCVDGGRRRAGCHHPAPVRLKGA